MDSSEKAISDLNPGITANSADVFEVAKDLISEGDWKLEVEGEKKQKNLLTKTTVRSYYINR